MRTAQGRLVHSIGLLLLLAGGCDRESPPSAHPTPVEASSPARAPGEQRIGSFRGFREVGIAAGLTAPQLCGDEPPRTILDVKSTGAALLDFDDDGRLDIFLTSGSTLDRWRAGVPGFPCTLYRNLGGLEFAPIEDRAGLPEFRFACGAAAADLDGDGRDDLVVTGIGRDRVFLNRGGTFEEVAESGLADVGWSTSAACADLDGDGILDLYIARYLDFDFENPPVHGGTWSCSWENRVVICGPRGLPAAQDGVYAGNGDGTFRDVTTEWGFVTQRSGYGLAVVISDLVGDPSPEIFVANDSSPNFLWSRGDGAWRDVGFVAGISVDIDGEEQAGMGADVGDLDGDGRFDLVVTNFEKESENIYLATDRGSFFDRSEAWGVTGPSRSTLSWGIGLVDFDLDGDLDLFVANGHVYPQADEVPTSAGYRQRDQLYLQERDDSGRPRLVERAEGLGITEATLSRGATFGDLDDDGDIDILVSHRGAPPALYENLGTPGRTSLSIRLEQPESKNREAIGARVELEVGDRKWVDEVRRQSSFQSSGDPRLFFALEPSGTATPKVTVRWPDGVEERFELEKRAGAITLTRGKSEEE